MEKKKQNEKEKETWYMIHETQEKGKYNQLSGISYSCVPYAFQAPFKHVYLFVLQFYYIYIKIWSLDWYFLMWKA